MIRARRLAPAVFAAALAACAGHAPRPSQFVAAEDADRGPLAARLLQPLHRELRFELSEPAYVAIFEIVPGRGVSVVYPASFDADGYRPRPAGSNTVFAAPLNVGRWFYADAVIPASGPTFLYMIASREPLRIGRVLSDPASLRRVVGFANFTQSNHERIMDALDARFVPEQLDEYAWASDWIALWPEPAPARPLLDPRLLVVPRCEGGYVAAPVPGREPTYRCVPRDSASPHSPPPRDPADSSAQPEPPAAPPGNAKTPQRPTDGQRPPAPRKSRSEPMSLVVDYGALGDGAGGSSRLGESRAAATRSPGRERARPWEGEPRGVSGLARRWTERPDRGSTSEPERSSLGSERGHAASFDRPAPGRGGAAPRTTASPRAMEPRHDSPSPARAPTRSAGGERPQSQERSQ